jgi:hypothetical protein
MPRADVISMSSLTNPLIKAFGVDEHICVALIPPLLTGCTLAFSAIICILSGRIRPVGAMRSYHSSEHVSYVVVSDNYQFIIQR